MATLLERWNHAKSDFEKTKLLFPPPLLVKLNKGFNFGPALKTFDKADAYEARAKAMIAVRNGKIAYDKEIKVVKGQVTKKDSPAFKALIKLEKHLLDILTDADDLAQPPRPGGGNVPYEVLRGYNLAGSYKPKYLDLQATKVDVVIEVDKTLDEMIKKGEESLRINYLGDLAKAEVVKVGNAFSKTMESLDATIQDLDGPKREAKIKEANEVLKHYAAIVQDRANAAVEKEWAEYLGRKKYLTNFRVKCVVKIVLGSIGVGVAIASAVVSFGTLWMNVVAAVKGISDIAQTCKTWAQDLDSVYASLLKDVGGLSELNRQREAAKKSGEGQKGSKAKEMAKEVLTGILPITKNMVSSASVIEDKAKQMLGLVSKLEAKADTLSGQLNKAIALMSKLPESQMTPAIKADVAKMQKGFEDMFAAITDIHGKSQNAARFGQRVLLAAQKLRKEDSWTATAAADVTGLGTKGVALYALANFLTECAKHGTTLLALL
jgi:hypothetical protein